MSSRSIRPLWCQLTKPKGDQTGSMESLSGGRSQCSSLALFVRLVTAGDVHGPRPSMPGQQTVIEREWSSLVHATTQIGLRLDPTHAIVLAVRLEAFEVGHHEVLALA